MLCYLPKIFTADETHLQLEAISVIMNITKRGSVKQIMEVVEKFHFINPLCGLLASKDDRVVSKVLDYFAKLFSLARGSMNCLFFLRVILNETGTTDNLKDLQSHKSPKISKKAKKIIKKQFVNK